MDISSKTYLRQKKAPRRKEATRDEEQGIYPPCLPVKEGLPAG